MLAEATARVGPEGVILVEGGRALACELEVRLGMHYDKGYVSAHFVTDESADGGRSRGPLYPRAGDPIAELDAIVPALNAFAKADGPLLFIAQDVAGQALSTLVVNKVKAGFEVAAAYAPGVGAWRRPMLEDVAIATGGLIVADARQSARGPAAGDARPGQARAAHRDATTIIEGAGDPALLGGPPRELRAAIEREKYLSYDREQLQQRLARLVSGIAVVKVGGASASAIEERKERASGAARALRAAAAGGSSPAAARRWSTPARRCASWRTRAWRSGPRIGVGRALLAPARRIAANAGATARLVMARLLVGRSGLRLRRGRRRFGDLHAAGIVDATRVVARRCAMRLRPRRDPHLTELR